MRIRVMFAIMLVVIFSLPVEAAESKPNIVLIFMDNFGYGELGVYGGGITRGAPTPRIDTLAEEGIRLTNFNVEAQCTPSRSALMTGRYAIRSGNGSVPITTGMYGLTQWEITMAEMLSDAGYATGMFGKWHLGHTKGRFPTNQGFDEWYGIPNSTDESLWPDQPQFNEVVKENLSPYAVGEGLQQRITSRDRQGMHGPRQGLHQTAGRSGQTFFRVFAIHANTHAGGTEQGIRRKERQW